jgi:hypothetical protein
VPSHILFLFIPFRIRVLENTGRKARRSIGLRPEACSWGLFFQL